LVFYLLIVLYNKVHTTQEIDILLVLQARQNKPPADTSLTEKPQHRNPAIRTSRNAVVSSNGQRPVSKIVNVFSFSWFKFDDYNAKDKGYRLRLCFMGSAADSNPKQSLSF
jgi:hypothetical protein